MLSSNNRATLTHGCNANVNANAGATNKDPTGSPSDNGSEKMNSVQSKENLDTNNIVVKSPSRSNNSANIDVYSNSMSQMKIINSSDAVLMDLLSSKSPAKIKNRPSKSPVRSKLSNKIQLATDASNSNPSPSLVGDSHTSTGTSISSEQVKVTSASGISSQMKVFMSGEEAKARSSANVSLASNSNMSKNSKNSSHYTHKDGMSLPSNDTSGGVVGGAASRSMTKIDNRRHHTKKGQHGGNDSHTSGNATATTATAISEINHEHLKPAPQSGLTIKVDNNKTMASPELSDATKQQSSLIKMNPKDSASPRRYRGRTSKSNIYKEFEASMVEMQLDSSSLNSWKENNGTSGGGGPGTTTGSNASVSVQSSSVGGLAYIETSSEKGSVASSSLPYAQNHHHYHGLNYNYHPTNAANSVSSKSTTSKRSHRSKASSSRQMKQQQQRQQRRSQLKSQQLNKLPLVPGYDEQILFEQRLCDEEIGVAVKKIHSNGKSQLRYVQCVSIPKEKLKSIYKNNKKYGTGNHNMSHSLPSPKMNSQRELSSSRSVTSLMGRITGRKNKHNQFISGIVGDDDSPKSQYSKSMRSENGSVGNNVSNIRQDDKFYSKALTWGNKKKVFIPLCQFVAVRKGKTTKRTKRNASDASRLLSIVTNDDVHGSLDIEAPTELDRDKFAKAFSVFLNVPLEEAIVGESVVLRDGSMGGHPDVNHFAASSIGDDMSSIPSISSYNSSAFTPRGIEYNIGAGMDNALLPNLTPSPSSSKDDSRLLGPTENNLEQRGNSWDGIDDDVEIMQTEKQPQQSKKSEHNKAQNDVFEMDSNLLSKGSQKKKRHKARNEDDDDASDVSSLTQGFDQEIVEELHQALTELRAELDASRAEAARAVKVAEQAIQSAESCSSNDWNSTVTHKAAEAAAQAQKRSAEAIAKQRQAEEKLAAERKSASFWRKQAQAAEEDVGGLQTRLAVAEVERAEITEELEREKRKAASYIHSYKQDHAMSERIQRETLANAAEQNKLLEIELDGTRRDLLTKADEVKSLQDTIAELRSEITTSAKDKGKKIFFGKSKKSRDNNNSRGRLLLDSRSSSFNNFGNLDQEESQRTIALTAMNQEHLLKIHAETSNMKKQFELLRRTTIEELKQLPSQAREWANAASKALEASQSEVAMLKNKLAMEMANRKKLLGEVQDLRGTVRVYCRPRPITTSLEEGSKQLSSIISVPSHEVGLLHRELVVKNGPSNPLSFDFDRMFTSNATQREVYAEMEELVLTSLDGYKSCLIAFGQNGCGKTHSLFGGFKILQGANSMAEPQVEISERGIHLLAMQQIFAVSKKRRGRFQDSFNLTIVEIYDDKLTDLVACIEIGLAPEDSSICSNSNAAESKKDKQLEIRSNIDGETIVQGLRSIPIESYEDVEHIWKQTLAKRAKKIHQLGRKLRSYEASSHIIATLNVSSINSVTGVGTMGKVQFVDLAASDVIPRRGSFSYKSRSATLMDNILAPIGNSNEWKYANKSIAQLADVVNARYQYSRSVPYRNSTLTHLLQDSLEADTKVVLLACVSSDAKDLQNTTNTMRFAAKMRKLLIGSATKHTMSFA